MKQWRESLITIPRAQYDALIAENAELREALEKLVPAGIAVHPQDFMPEWIEAARILAKTGKNDQPVFIKR